MAREKTRLRQMRLNISIVGCGWVGKALKEHIQDTFNVRCSDRETLFTDDTFYTTDFLLIALPPKNNYETILTHMLTQISVDVKVILLSSTSVYTQTQGSVNEEDSLYQESIPFMLTMEKYFKQSHPNTLTLRLGGLMGYERISGKYTAGKTLETNTYTNYVHRDDVVEVISAFLTTDFIAEVFNVVCPVYIGKKEVFDKNANKFGFEKTMFLDEKIKGKTVSSTKLQKYLNYSFKKNNPLSFW